MPENTIVIEIEGVDPSCPEEGSIMFEAEADLLKAVFLQKIQNATSEIEKLIRNVRVVGIVRNEETGNILSVILSVEVHVLETYGSSDNYIAGIIGSNTSNVKCITVIDSICHFKILYSYIILTS